MLKRKYRLLKRAKFGKRFSVNTPFFVLKFARNEESFSRFGFIVSKSIDKRSAVRNRIKRRLRLAVETNLGKIKEGYDILFIARKEVSAKTAEEISKEVLSQLKKQRLIK